MYKGVAKKKKKMTLDGLYDFHIASKPPSGKSYHNSWKPMEVTG